MKVLVLLVAISAVVCFVNADDSAECKDQVTAFDCAGHGEGFYNKDSEGYCRYYCKSGDVLLGCEQVHPAPDTAAYQNAECPGSGPAFNCEGTEGRTKGLPHWSYCKFHCMVGGDILYTCPQIWRA